VENGSYARLSEMTLGYTLDSKKFGFIKALGANRIQLDLVGRNLLTITKYSGLNPESGTVASRIDDTVYPLLRTFTFATTITF